MEPKLKEYSFYKMTRGMCRKCRKIIDSRIFIQDEKVYQENMCPDCGNVKTLIAEDKEWYFKYINFPIKLQTPQKINTPRQNGCPYDCGICPWHENRPSLPVFSITNACNLRCPICLTFNREDEIYFMSVDEMKKTVDFLMENNDSYDLVNIKGGEPTLHPNLIELLKVVKRDEIGRITVNSNGLRLGEDENLVKQLKDLGVYIILSFDTLDSETSVKIHGKDIVEAKFKALDLLQKYDIGVTLLNVMIKGVNDHEIFDIINLSSKYKNIRSITIQNMTFTGQGGSNFKPQERLTLDMAMRIIQEKSGNIIKKDNFFPLPSNHPLCYSIGYFFRDEETLRSFTDLLSVDDLIELIGTNYIMRPDERFNEKFNEAIAESWAEESNPELLGFVKKLLKKMYPVQGQITPFERQKIAEDSILTVYIHAHMDEDNFDISRIVCCTDLVPVDGEKLIPACAYNLFYRMKDERFWVENNE